MRTIKLRELKQRIAGLPRLYDDCDVVVRTRDEDDATAFASVTGVALEQSPGLQGQGTRGVFVVTLDAEAK